MFVYISILTSCHEFILIQFIYIQKHPKTFEDIVISYYFSYFIQNIGIDIDMI